MLMHQVSQGLQILQVMIPLDSYPSQVPQKSSTIQESMFNSFFQNILATTSPTWKAQMFFSPILRKSRLGQHTLRTAQMHQKREKVYSDPRFLTHKRFSLQDANPLA